MTEPWAPDPTTVGRAPTNGTGGERGSSAFAGNADVRADLTSTDGEVPARGPEEGDDYYESDPGYSNAGEGARYASGDTSPGAELAAPVATAVAGAKANVTFTPPNGDGGSAVTGYTVTSTPGGRTATGASSPLQVTGLTVGTAYTFKVAATNAKGTGASSPASNSVTAIA